MIRSVGLHFLGMMLGVLAFDTCFDRSENEQPSAASLAADLCNLDDPTIRSKAEDAVARFDGNMVPYLVECLNHESPVVKWTVCSALMRVGPAARAAVPDLVPLLHHPNQNVVKSAIMCLGKVGSADPDALAALCNLLDEDPNGLRQVELFGSLRNFGKRAVPALSRQLEHDCATHRALAAQSLLAIGADAGEAAGLLGRLARSDENGFVRRTALAALASIGRPAIDELSRTLKEAPDLITMRATTAVLAGLGPSAAAAVPILLDAAIEKDAHVRFWAVRALMLSKTGSHDERVFQAFLGALQDSDAGVRWQAVNALQLIAIDKPSCLPALVDALNDRDQLVRHQVVFALEELVEQLLDRHADEEDVAELRRHVAFNISSVQPVSFATRP